MIDPSIEPKIIDSHCHLFSKEFESNLETILQRAEAANITKILNVCTTLEEAENVYNLANLHENIFASCGVHPHDASKTLQNYKADRINEILTHFAHRIKTVAIGETGLDYYYDNSDKKDQLDNFDIHLTIAQEHKLPIIVHTRSAEKDTIAMLKSYDITGVLHCFTGSYDMAKKALDMGLYISISGIITFKNAAELRETVSKLPTDRLLIETDAPFLAPIPYRGKVNEPSYITKTLESLAIIFGINKHQLAQQFFNNTLNLFTKMK